MNTHRRKNVKFNVTKLIPLLVLTLLCSFGLKQAYAVYGTPTRYEAESSNLSNCSVASVNSGFSGSGYVTGLTSMWSKLSFDKGVSGLTPAKIDIRYANGTGASVTNLALYVGSTKKQNLVFPATASWSTWATLTVTFSIEGGYQNIIIKSESDVSSSINIDYNDLSIDDGTGVPTVATPAFSPGTGTYTSAQSVTISTSTTGATIYYTQDGSTPTTSSIVYSGAISVGSTKTIRALATKSGMTDSNIGSATYTINLPPPAPGAFTQTTPASGATGVSATPAFNWAASSNAASYALVVSTSSSYTSPVINQTGITGTSYTPGIALANSTVYYWKVTATNATASTVATNAGLLFTTAAATPVVATPTFSPTGGTYTSAQSVTINTATTGATIYYTTDGSTPTTASTLYSGAISVGSSQTINALATKSGSTNSQIGTATYTINIPPPAPGAFTQTAPAGGATGVSSTPAFSWAASSNAASYALVVSTSSSYTSPVVNQAGITGTSYTPGTSLSNSTVYYWKVTATNSTGSTVATNAGLSFTTGATPPPPPPQAGILREYWAGIPGTAVSALTNNANFPNSPTSSSVLTQFQSPQDFADSYGQKISGYLTPTTTGSYTFWISSDDDSELWLSTNSSPGNKVKIASVTGWTNFQQYNKYSTQQSAAINLTAGNYYYIEALQKEDTGGDHVTVVWQGPGITQQIISSTYLVTAPPTPPGAFTQTAPAAGATGVSLAPTFSWAASSNAASYTLIVSTSSSYASPVINQSGISGTSYAGGGLAGTTTYYWKVTAVNAAGSVVSTNAGTSFTTLTPPAPGTFTQTAPASGATGISTYPVFSWAASSNASTYALVVSTSSSYASPIINQSGLTTTNYSAPNPFATSTVYYWKVTATNSTGSTVATNAGISFTTGTTSGTTYYVSTTGSDVPSGGTQANPWKTLAYAASQITPGTGNKTISLAPGTYVETQCTFLPVGVNILGAGESNTIITANGALPPPNGVDASSADYHLWPDGSLIQLLSPIYSGSNPRYGAPADMIAAADGSQTLSGFKVDGHNKTVKVGIWNQNRSNVTMHHVTFVNFKQSGSVFSRGDMWWYEPLPDGKWMNNISIHDCTFTNAGSDTGEQVGNLCIGGIDGADIYNITINDNAGEGIKFAHVGHHRNTKIHDCYIRVPEYHAAWTEFMSMELWNTSYGNEIYNMDLNTWISLANFGQLSDDYDVTAAHPWNLKVHDNKIIDTDATGGTETIEVALSGVEIYNNYFQDKPYYLAIWGGSGWSGGTVSDHKIYIHHNIFANVNRPSNFGFGDGAAVFTASDASANDIKIYNNVFDNLGNSVSLSGASNIDIRNNVFLNSAGDDVKGGSGVTFKNNLRYNTSSSKPNWVVSTTVDGTNYNGTLPGFKNTGSRFTTYYQPASGSSFAVNKGVDVGYPYSGSAPDIGRWENGLTSFRSEALIAEESSVDNDGVSTYPNPSNGLVTITSVNKISAVQVMNAQGKTIFTKAVNNLNKTQIDLSQQSNDMYILKVKHEKGLMTKKVVLIK